MCIWTVNFILSDKICCGNVRLSLHPSSSTKFIEDVLWSRNVFCVFRIPIMCLLSTYSYRTNHIHHDAQWLHHVDVYHSIQKLKRWLKYTSTHLKYIWILPSLSTVFAIALIFLKSVCRWSHYDVCACVGFLINVRCNVNQDFQIIPHIDVQYSTVNRYENEMLFLHHISIGVNDFRIQVMKIAHPD